MHIVFLLHLKKNFGGGSYSIFKFAESLACLGHKIVIFYVGNSKVLGNDIHPNLKIYKIFEVNFIKSGLINSVIEKVYDKVLLENYLNRNSKDIDFLVGYQRESAIKAKIYSDKYKIKLVNLIFETPDWLMEKWPQWKQVYLNNEKLRRTWQDFKKALLSSDLIFANSNLSSLESEKWLDRKPELVVYPGISFPDTSFENIKKENQIIYVGRLEEGKNVHEIIEALALLKVNVNFVVCGGGSLIQELKDLAISKNVKVEFKGKVSEKDKWEEINKSLFMVFPSSFEGFGMPPMEALSMKVPCICSDIQIFKEVYGNYVDYFEEHNVLKLAEKIKLLLSDINSLNLKGEIGYNFVHANFGWNKSAKKMESKLLEYLNHSKPIN